VILEEGSATTYVAIFARVLGVPVVGRVEVILNAVEPGDPIIVDDDNGQVFLRPADEVWEQFQRNLQVRVERPARYDLLSGPFLWVLKSIVQSCAEVDVPATVCGEMPGRPLDAPALVSLGCRRLSIRAASIGPVKEKNNVKEFPWNY